MSPCTPHHWLLETPQGPTVQGVCKHCGEVRTFASSLAETFGAMGQKPSARGKPLRVIDSGKDWYRK